MAARIAHRLPPPGCAGTGGRDHPRRGDGVARGPRRHAPRDDHPRAAARRRHASRRRETAAPLWRCPAPLHRPGRLRARGHGARSARRPRPRYRDAATASVAAQRRTEAATRARQAPRAGRGPPAHRRADQPPRPRGDRVARRLHARRLDRIRARVPRPPFPRQRVHPGDRGRGRDHRGVPGQLHAVHEAARRAPRTAASRVRRAEGVHRPPGGLHPQVQGRSAGARGDEAARRG